MPQETKEFPAMSLRNIPISIRLFTATFAFLIVTAALPVRAGTAECPPDCDMACCEAKTTASAVPSDKAYSVGATVQDITLHDAQSGETKSLSDVAGDKYTVLVFWNQTCPFVAEAQDRVTAFHKAYKDKGVSVVAIDAGANNSPESIAKYAKTRPFPILVNQDSKVAAKFAATRTPEVFILDKDMVIQYHGAFDSGKQATPDGERANYVKDVVNQLLDGKEPSVRTTKAFGCTVKYANGVRPLEPVTS
jgi:thiol-disulfide isomerase/thioredoxin